MPTLYILVVVALVGTSALATGPSVPAPMAAAEVAQRYGSSVVLIQAKHPNGQTRTGSGFVIAPEGVVATSLHLLDGALSLLVLIEGERFESVRVRAFDIERDLALIQIESARLEAVVTGDTSTLQRGDPIYVISNPLGLVGTVSEGILSAWREPSAEEADDLDPMAQLQGLPQGRLLQISAPVSPGSSGAPVFDANGYVVGMVAAGVAAGALSLNFAVSIEGVVPLLNVDEGWDLSSLQDSLDRRRQDLADPYLVDARYYLAMADLEEASRALDRALGVFPRSDEALILKGEVLLGTGQIEEAGRIFQTVTAANPESAEAWEKLGFFVLNHRPQRRGEAAAAFEKALEIDPWRAEAAFGLGQAYIEQGRLGDAREMLELAVESDRDHIQASLALGKLCFVLEDMKAAEEALEHAVWLDPDNPQAHLGLSAVYRKTGATARARRHWQRYLELSERRP